MAKVTAYERERAVRETAGLLSLLATAQAEAGDEAASHTTLRVLAARYPGVLGVLMEDGDLRPGVAVSVGDQLAQDGLLEPVAPDDEVHFLPAFAGG